MVKGKHMLDATINHLDIWASAQTIKTKGRGRGKSADNQSTYGINKLRGLILELAVHGKLVSQDPKDEPAKILLEKIATEKERLTKEGKIKKQKPLPGISEKEIPFNLPDGWKWASLDAVSPMSLFDGDWVESKDQDPDGSIRLIQLADIGEGRFRDKSNRFINEDAFKRLKCTELQKDDILIARLPSPIGRACIFPGLDQRSITAVDVAILRSSGMFFEDYLVHAINSMTFRLQVESFGKGVTRLRISTGNLKTIVFPLPPLAEQHRIVAKVDKLMALCDQLEQHGTDSNAAHQILLKTLLEALTNTTDQGEFEVAWQHTAEHFEILFTTEQSIDQLKQAILQLAVMGKLIPQNLENKSATELLKKIKVKKHLLIEDKVIRKEKLKLDNNDIEIDNLPKGWRAVYMQDITSVITCGIASTPKYYDKGRIFLSAKNVKPYKFMPDEHKYVDEETYSKIVSWGANPEKGDILLTRVGAGIGEAALIDRDIDFAYYVSLTLIKPIQPHIYSQYLLHWINSPEGVNKSLENIYGRGVSQGNLNVNQVRKFVIPVPPLSEQHRIVAKVNELFAICDTLKERLYDAQTTKIKLADAVVEEAVA
jgi:type I restriction enzyme, S subunit